MPLIKYEDKRFHQKSLDLIQKVNAVITDYQAQGYDLTLRQAYYQLVSRNVIENCEKSYKNLGNLINDGRLAGLIDWYAIEDRTRNLCGYNYYDNPSEFLESVVPTYRLNPWEGQEYHVECWVEKDALSNVVGQAANRYDVRFFACRGFPSISELWRAARRFIRECKNGKKGIIIHLGDHDPSGLDMTRDLNDRLKLLGADVQIERIALNMNQIEQYNPPPNPAKTTDTRYKE